MDRIDKALETLFKRDGDDVTVTGVEIDATIHFNERPARLLLRVEA